MRSEYNRKIKNNSAVPATGPALLFFVLAVTLKKEHFYVRISWNCEGQIGVRAEYQSKNKKHAYNSYMKRKIS